jgi:hypothetical protein
MYEFHSSLGDSADNIVVFVRRICQPHCSNEDYDVVTINVHEYSHRPSSGTVI